MRWRFPAPVIDRCAAAEKCCEGYLASARRDAHLQRRSSRKQFLKLLSAMAAAVLLPHALGSTLADAAQLAVIEITQIMHHVIRAGGQQDFFARREECLQPRPGVGSDSRTACCRFKQPHRRRKAG